MDIKDLKILKGKVYYENGLAAENAVVIMEKVSDCNQIDFVSYTITNEYGEYLFIIDNTDCSYRVSAFEGNLSDFLGGSYERNKKV